MFNLKNRCRHSRKQFRFCKWTFFQNLANFGCAFFSALSTGFAVFDFDSTVRKPGSRPTFLSHDGSVAGPVIFAGRWKSEPRSLSNNRALNSSCSALLTPILATKYSLEWLIFYWNGNWKKEHTRKWENIHYLYTSMYYVLYLRRQNERIANEYFQILNSTTLYNIEST